MKIGDFVHSYTKGIWQIYRIEKYKSINQLTGKIEKKETAFLKRFVSESYKKSFTEESCDISFVVPLSADEKIKLNSFVEKNKDLFDKFNQYSPKQIDSVLVMHIRMLNSDEIQKVKTIFSDNNNLTYKNINNLIKENNLNREHGYGWTLQFVSENFKMKHGVLIYKFLRILEF